ncbi:hypothetical protein ID866_12753 [Astraeus odoratus]|nr:hypothetical protein ID866_12753 [Astraeus odoratus]
MSMHKSSMTTGALAMKTVDWMKVPDEELATNIDDTDSAEEVERCQKEEEERHQREAEAEKKQKDEERKRGASAAAEARKWWWADSEAQASGSQQACLCALGGALEDEPEDVLENGTGVEDGTETEGQQSKAKGKGKEKAL